MLFEIRSLIVVGFSASFDIVINQNVRQLYEIRGVASRRSEYNFFMLHAAKCFFLLNMQDRIKLHIFRIAKVSFICSNQFFNWNLLINKCDNIHSKNLYIICIDSCMTKIVTQSFISLFTFWLQLIENLLQDLNHMMPVMSISILTQYSTE